jgi:hypothetical protein
MFTGHKDTDYIVLMKLDDYDLSSFCSTNKYLKNLYDDDETFWRNRTIKRFGQYLGGIEKLKEYKNNYKNYTWKKYYISLINFLEKLYIGEYKFKDQDKRNLYKIIKENSIIFLNNINEYIVKHKIDEFENNVLNVKEKNKFYDFLDEQFKQDMINPNIIFVDLGTEEIDDIILEYILKSKDRRIKLGYQNNLIIKNVIEDVDKIFSEEIFKIFAEDPRINFKMFFDYDISYKFLPILANSKRLKPSLHDKLLKLMIGEEENKKESFKEYANKQFQNILSKIL